MKNSEINNSQTQINAYNSGKYLAKNVSAFIYNNLSIIVVTSWLENGLPNFENYFIFSARCVLCVWKAKEFSWNHSVMLNEIISQSLLNSCNSISDDWILYEISNSEVQTKFKWYIYCALGKKFLV